MGSMYQITLWDHNCVSCTSGVFSLFTDNIESFQKEWFKLNTNEEEKKRFLRSLAGELVTDYYPTNHDEEINIVKQDPGARILYRRTFDFYQRMAFNMVNGFGVASTISAEESTFWFRGIQYDGKYYLVGRYKLKGVCRLDEHIDSEGCQLWLRQVHPWGNPIIKKKYGSKVGYKHDMLTYDTSDLDNFRNDSLELIGYIIVYDPDSREDLKRHMESDEFLLGSIPSLLRDIPGDGG